MLIAMPCCLSKPVNASGVNWLPWSVLKISRRQSQNKAAPEAFDFAIAADFNQA